MKYFIDTEFIEYPHTIDLISIGIVDEDRRQLYLISDEFDESKANDWVKKNVIAQLPSKSLIERVPKKEMAEQIIKFIAEDSSTPEFWANYCSYDWVVFCWLFGAMIDLPNGWPMYCNDIQQLRASAGNPGLPGQTEGLHDALDDAKWNKIAYNYLVKYKRERSLV